jgi:hypothetical protein
VRQQRFGHNDDTEQIRFNLCAKIRERSIFHGVHVAIAGVVHEYVDATEGFDRGFDGVLGLRLVRYVERHSPYTLSKLTRDFRETLRIARRGLHSVAGLQRFLRQGSAQAA